MANPAAKPRPTRGRIIALIFVGAALLLLCCAIGVIVFADGDGDEPAVERESPSPEGSTIPESAEPEPTENPEPEPTEAEALDPRFGTCGEAVDAGYGPYHRGQDPEYDWYRDADGDGVVCER